MKYVRLLRLHQYYKNLVIFIAILFTGNFFHINDLRLTALGFVALCLVSSANYIINDIHDRKEDRRHPRKKNRPIARGDIGMVEASIIAVLLFAAGYSLAYYLSSFFAYIVAGLFALTQAYTFVLKREPYLDIIVIGINFVMRAVSGAFIIDAEISPWLIICAFFLAVFLAAAKRRADPDTRKYSETEADIAMTTNMSVLILSFTLYTFLKGDHILMLTIPVVTYALYRHMSLAMSGSIVAAKPELAFFDVRLFSSMLLWGAMVFASMYI